MNTVDKLNALLGRRRETHGLTQAKLARMLGETESQVSKWLGGKLRPGDTEYLRLARALGVTVDYLFDAEQADPESGLTEDERTILDMARTLTYPVAKARLLTPGRYETSGGDDVEEKPFYDTEKEKKPPGKPGRTGGLRNGPR